MYTHNTNIYTHNTNMYTHNTNIHTHNTNMYSKQHNKDTQKHIVQHPHIHTAQMMITTILHTQCTHDDYYNNQTQRTHVNYNLSQLVKKMNFKALLKVDSESLCLRSIGRSSHVTGPC